SDAPRVPGPARARRAVAHGAGMGADRHAARGIGRARRAWRRAARFGAGGARSRRRPDSREAPLAAHAARGRRCRAERRMIAERRAAEARAAWVFLAPALALIGVFFVLPILVGLLLSFTDFDIYAIADPSTVRVVGLENYG